MSKILVEDSVAKKRLNKLLSFMDDGGHNYKDIPDLIQDRTGDVVSDATVWRWTRGKTQTPGWVVYVLTGASV